MSFQADRVHGLTHKNKHKGIFPNKLNAFLFPLEEGSAAGSGGVPPGYTGLTERRLIYYFLFILYNLHTAFYCIPDSKTISTMQITGRSRAFQIQGQHKFTLNSLYCNWPGKVFEY